MAKTTMVTGRSQRTIYAKNMKVGEIGLLVETLRTGEKNGRDMWRRVSTPVVRLKPDSTNSVWVVPLRQPVHGELGVPVKLDSNELISQPRRATIVVNL